METIGLARLAGVSDPGWQFFKDHPYKIAPEPYRSLPSAFPAYCRIIAPSSNAGHLSG